ncbi:MAG: hypothetical protein NTY07_20365 [Bacteroidia bacterium]|nr:hypothetical protein [Bacteroidia bacterium]
MNQLKIRHRLLVAIFIWGFSAISYFLFAEDHTLKNSLGKNIKSQMHQNIVSNSLGMTVFQDSIEKKLYDFVNEINIRYSNKHYLAKNIDELIETSLNKLITSGIPKHQFSNENFSIWYKEKNFKTIIDRIDSLDVNEAAYDSSDAFEIMSLIDQIKQKEKKIYTYLYFEDHFWKVLKVQNRIDSIGNHAYQILNDKNDELYSIKIHSLNIIGDFKLSHNYFNSAMYSYFQSFRIAKETNKERELAEIENRIAILYTKLNSIIFLKNDQLHFASAANWYSYTNDTINLRISKLKEINSKCQSLYNYRIKFFSNDLDPIKKTLNYGLKEFQKRDSITNDDFYLFNSLAIYCELLGSSKDSLVAADYHKLATLATLNLNGNFDFDNLLTALDYLADSYKLQDNEEMAIHYFDLALRLLDIQNDKIRKSYFIYKKANAYIALGKLKYALKLIKERSR